MAIKKDLIESGIGTPFIGAYYRIEYVDIARQNGALACRGDVSPQRVVTMGVVGYAVRPVGEGVGAIDRRNYGARMDEVEACAGDNFLAKCYAWVMSRDDMAGCVSD